jgi:hypothetical protein
MRIVERGPTVDLEYAADVVMRGRLARLTADAAAAVQQAAQHPGLQPADVLHTTHLAFDAVRATAGRMSGEAGISTRLAGLDSGPAEQPSTMAGAVHSSAQIIHLRRRSTDLRNAVVGNVATPDTDENVDSRVGARVDAAQPGWSECPAGSDAGPDSDV